MQTERLVQPAINWLKDRPSLAKEQLENPIFALLRAKEEIDELIEAIHMGAPREEIRGELADVFNFVACAEWVLVNTYGFTEQELVDYSHYVYGIRNDYKYPEKGYQNGTPTREQLRTDANNFFLATVYYTIAEKGINPEYGG